MHGTRESAAGPPAETEIVAARAVARLARFAERALTDLSLPHYRMLSAIAEGDARASRVAAKFSVGKPTVSATVDALCRGGLVIKTATETDQRASTLELTAKGRAVLESAEQSLIAALHELAAYDRAGAPLISTLAALGVALEEQAVARNTARQSTGAQARGRR